MAASKLKILKCSCKSEQQDALHGVGMRVFNQVKTKGIHEEGRCTSCGAIKSLSDK